MSNISLLNKVKAKRIETQRVTFSPELEDNRNTNTVKKDMLTHGIIKFTI